ncbi:MAG: carbohydrate ABC transporter permease [Treponema sp.]|jgi:ABC-type glycerol-3-phosphate transport system permease component|nr:carbohydrate ABC transporter permease [Treponema sp.]
MRKVLGYTFLSIIAVLMLIPFLWMLLLSFKFQAEISRANTILPEIWTMRNYFRVFEIVPIVRWFFNSFIVTVSATTIILFTSSIVGFVFAKYQFRFKNLVFWFILATMMVPPQTTMIPSFLLISRLGLYDKLPSLFVAGMVGGFGIFLCRQFIEDIPDSLCEAAIIDGAKDFYIYFRIIIPLIRPAIGALAIFMFLQYWNDYMLPLLYLNKIENMTMSLAISFFSTQRTTDIGAIMAAATLVMMPVTVVFLVLQKQFIKGIAIAGLK